MADEASILCWSGGWSLPSLDPACLQALTYAKFAGFPVKVNICNNPYKSPTGTLPALFLPDNIFCSCDDILEYLKSSNYNADEVLTDKQRIDTAAISCYVEDMLRPAVMYMMWLRDDNYTQFTRGWYAKQLKFPYNYFIPGQFFNHSCNFVAHKLNIEECDVINEETEEKLNKRAKVCFETLANILADQEFFFGESPTTLDSKVLAYLAIILKAPLPKNKLKSELIAHSNLEQFCEKILHLYFPSVMQEQIPRNSTTSDDSDSTQSNTVNTFLSVGFAIIAMVFYALSSGLVIIEVEPHADHSVPSTSPTDDNTDAEP